MPTYSDSFERANGPLGSMPGGGPTYETVSGTWSILNGKPSTSTAASLSPIVGVTIGSGDADLRTSIGAGGGDSIYGRISGVGNYIRGRLRTYASSVTETVTEYEWIKTIPGNPGYTVYEWDCVTRTGSEEITYVTYRKQYNHNTPAANPHGNPPLAPTTSPAIYLRQEVRLGSTPIWPNLDQFGQIYPQNHPNLGGGQHPHLRSGTTNIFDYHEHGVPGHIPADGTAQGGYTEVSRRVTGGYSFTHTLVRNTTGQAPTGYFEVNFIRSYQEGQTADTLSAPWWTRDAINPPEAGYYRTGATRQVQVQAGITRYDVILERRENDILTTVATKTLDVAPLALALRLAGSAITLSAIGSGSAAVAVLTDNSLFNSSVNRHGFGRGPSDQTALGLDNFQINPLNTLPGPPTLVSPVGGAVVNRAAAVRLVHNFNDADAGDSRSRSEQQWRLQGQSTWNPNVKLGPDNFHEYPANHFPAGTIEWQARDADSTGNFGTWSATGTFSAAVVPAGPVILEPVAGTTVSTSTTIVKWQTTTQASYQVLILRDGNPDYDSGRIQSATTRQHTVPHPYNASDETVVVRTFSSQGLASADSTVPITVAFDQPATAKVAFTEMPLRGSILLTIVNPTGGGTPAMANTVRIREQDNPATEFVAVRGLSKNAAWEYMTPASGVEYEFLIETKGENGTTARSPWIITSTVVSDGGGPIVIDPDEITYGSGTYGSGLYGS